MGTILWFIHYCYYFRKIAQIQQLKITQTGLIKIQNVSTGLILSVGSVMSRLSCLFWLPEASSVVDSWSTSHLPLYFFPYLLWLWSTACLLQTLIIHWDHPYTPREYLHRKITSTQVITTSFGVVLLLLLLFVCCLVAFSQTHRRKGLWVLYWNHC